MRERLIELLSAADGVGKRVIFDNANLKAYIAELADHLLANGVIMPPCKVGDTVYFVIYDSVIDEWHISPEPVVDVTTKGFYTSGHEGSNENGDLWLWEDVGDDIFLTQEEAEAALAERSRV